MLKNNINFFPSDSRLTFEVTQALEEDIGEGDITAQLIEPDQHLQVRLISRENAILCGKKWFTSAFIQLNPEIDVKWLVDDGESIYPDQTLCEIEGNARHILSAERTAINFLQTLSATATITHHYQSLIEQTQCRILDTRKTIPGLRLAQKYAVSCGGGLNHRIGLYDAFLLKENHLAAAGSISKACENARQLNSNIFLEVEVENLEQLQQAIDAKVDRALLDNFSLQMLEQAVTLNQQRIQLEASGNITETNILSYAQTGVDFISIGALTKHIRAIDFSMRFID